ncbi:toxin-antitoxin system HicB family antitoxin [Sphaerisporangium sp. NPDC051011]|uniref:toxin-antitoxin system HicB family antitoxin n=1 Tax=Sphaerisporangium sp. NPDC051011 TaxID=3155792 RepID=UPI0033CF70DE
MGHVNLRLPDDLHEQARAAAAADDRSLNSWLVAVIRRAVAPGQTPDRRDGDPASTDPLRGGAHSSRPE